MGNRRMVSNLCSLICLTELAHLLADLMVELDHNNLDHMVLIMVLHRFLLMVPLQPNLSQCLVNH
jgi:hypothetical protein